jgi:flagellar basal body-associated protein FliL
MTDSGSSPVFSGKTLSTVLAVLISVVLIGIGTMMVWSVLRGLPLSTAPSFSSAIQAPVNLMWQFRRLTFLVAVLVAVGAYYGFTKAKLWFLLPVSISLIGIYWFASSMLVVNQLEAYGRSVEQKAAEEVHQEADTSAVSATAPGAPD